jgi:hypothetical protein
MPLDLQAALPSLLPVAVEWVTTTAAEGAKIGTTVGAPGIALARKVGVSHPEMAGSIAAFLTVYLQQLVTVGYENSPFEIDARAHEVHAA